MITSILKTKSVYWELKIENNKIYLENEKLEKEKINIRILNDILTNNNVNKNKINSSLLLGENEYKEKIFVKRDSEEYKEYLKMKNFEKKELLPGNIFLYEMENAIEEYKYLGCLYENDIYKYKRYELSGEYYDKIVLSSYKTNIAYNLNKKTIEFINTKQIVDLINDNEETIEELFIREYLSEVYKTFLDNVKKDGRHRYTIYSLNKPLKKSEIMFLYEENK